MTTFYEELLEWTETEGGVLCIHDDDQVSVWSVLSESDPMQLYFVTRVGKMYFCGCSAFRYSKREDSWCKHIIPLAAKKSAPTQSA